MRCALRRRNVSDRWGTSAHNVSNRAPFGGRAQFALISDNVSNQLKDNRNNPLFEVNAHLVTASLIYHRFALLFGVV